MNKLDQYHDMLENLCVNCNETTEMIELTDIASDSLSFVFGLNNAMRAAGAALPEVPDVEKLEQAFDSLCGELTAACLFLSEKSFTRVPDMLRAIADAIEKTDKPFTDDETLSGPSVPSVVVDGYRKLADRIENTRVQKKEIFDKLQKNP